MASSEGKRALGRYLLEEQIATGTTATIWRARDTKTGGAVAVKRFHPYLLSDRVARRRMDEEARAARRVHGPTIVTAIDKLTTGDQYALVFPFVPGASLAEVLRTTGTLAAEQAAAVAADVADALSAIHRAGFVHRDVKPGNILLADDGGARLLDFGISRTVTDEIEGEQALTGAGLAIGTLPYMAPERLNAQPATASTDVYSLGVVLYEMLAGSRPFAALSPVALAHEQRLPAARIADAPEPLVDLALRCLNIDPLVRPTAADVARALRRWRADPLASDAPTAAVVLGGSPEPRSGARAWWARTNVAAVVAVGALALVAFIALAAMSGGTLQPGSAAPTDPLLAQAAGPGSTPRATLPTPSPAPVVTPVNTAQPSAQPAASGPSPTTQQPPPKTAHAHHPHKTHHHRHGHGHHGRHRHN